MNHSLSWMFASLMKVPFYVYFGHFWAIFGTFLNLSVSRIPCLLNRIISELNQQIFLESNNILNWVKQYWIKYWMNHFLAKFEYWIESDWVSDTTKWHRLLQTAKMQVGKGRTKNGHWPSSTEYWKGKHFNDVASVFRFLPQPNFEGLSNTP